MSKILTLGESMIRLSSQKGNRLSNASQLFLHYGGAEANVAVNLSILGHDVSYATKLPYHNGLSDNIVQQMKGMGVDCNNIVYGEGRLGSYFLEVGVGLRATNVIYDRKYSTMSLMEEIEWNLDELFKDVELFHITGVTLALSPFWQKAGVQLIKEAKARGIAVSFDMNYRQKMWSYDEAQVAFGEVLPLVDYLSAGYLDAIHFVGVDEIGILDWRYYMEQIAKQYPNIKYLYGTNRETINPNTYNMSGYIWDREAGKGYLSKEHHITSVVDRVGAGDAYAAGILDGIALDKPLQEVVDFAMATSALKHTIFGDVNLFSRDEIEHFMTNSNNVNR